MVSAAAATLAALPPARRRAVIAVDVVFGGATAAATFAGWHRPNAGEALGAAVLAVVSCVAAAASVPRVTDRDREGRSDGAFVDMTSFFFVLTALLLPPELVPLVCLPSFVVDRVWARRPLYAVILNAAVLTWVAQAAAFVRLLGAGDAGGTTLRWAVAAWAAAALFTLGDHLWLPSGRWMIRGVVPTRADLREAMPDLHEWAGAATAVLAATLWRLSPGLGVHALAPVAILHQLLHFREVQLSARTDGKTGLLNYRWFAECAQRELARARRAGAGVALLVVDMDRLRDVNNTYGHQCGDLALLHVAGTLEKHSRPSDLVCRFGGEEFLVLLPGASGDAAVEAAERLRAAVAGEALTFGEVPVRVTVSVGVAVLGPDAADLDGLVAVADERVYAAKHAGRNRVVAGAAAASP
jgi:diguanylate cyclase (GGDEF)-like protein